MPRSEAIPGFPVHCAGRTTAAMKRRVPPSRSLTALDMDGVRVSVRNANGKHTIGGRRHGVTCSMSGSLSKNSDYWPSLTCCGNAETLSCADGLGFMPLTPSDQPPKIEDSPWRGPGWYLWYDSGCEAHRI